MSVNRGIHKHTNSLEPREDNDECPLCLEPIEADDIDFYPCPCGYQICRFCWHRLANEEDSIEPGKSSRGLCPACRQEYPESPVGFNSNLSIEAMSELVKNKKKKRKQANKLKLNQLDKQAKSLNDVKKDEKNLAGLRVVQKNLVFVIGIPSRLSQEDLRREFSKFGKIHKLVIGNNTNNNLVSSVYVTFLKPEDAMKAIQTLNQSTQCNGNNQIIGNGFKELKGNKKGSNLTLRASLGTTKYCTHWLKNMQCPKLPECMYLHELADPDASFTKEEMQQGKHTDYERRLLEQYLSKKSGNNNINRSNFSLPKESMKQQQMLDFHKDYSDLSTYSRDDNFVNNHNSDSESYTMDNHNSNSVFSRKTDSVCNSNGSCTRYNFIDEMIGISSDSSTSFSTCSSGSLPQNQGSSNEVDDRICQNSVKDKEWCKDSGCKSHPDVDMEPPDSPRHSIDDDGLDFDPITISTTELEDLIRNNSYSETNSNNCTDIGHTLNGYTSIGSPTLSTPTLSQPYLSSTAYSPIRQISNNNLRTPPHINSLTQQEHWRNSLKALLPNVNITFNDNSSSANSYYKTTSQQRPSQQPQYPVQFPSQILQPWYPQNSRNHAQLLTNQVNPFAASGGHQNCQIPLGISHQGYLPRSVVRQKQPPPGFANF